jgi:S1-C subfamily serine protease
MDMSNGEQISEHPTGDPPKVPSGGSTERKKDVWDKVSALSGIVTGVLVALIGFYATQVYDGRSRDTERQDRQRGVAAVELEAVEKFFPHLMSKDETEKQAAIQAISSLANPDLAAKLAKVFGGAGARAALANIAVAVPTARPALEVALNDLFKTFQASVVLIRVDSPDARRMEGTGFLIGRSNYLLTAASLFPRSGNALHINIAQQLEGTSRDAQLVSLDNSTGLALLRVGEPVSAPALNISRTQIEPADKVSVLGFQSAQDLSVSVSLVVSKSADMIALDLSATPTMVGAPIVDNAGEVVGVLVQAGAPRSNGVSARAVASFLESSGALH